MALFGFYDSCGELQSWLENQTALLQMRQPQADDLEATRLKYKVLPLWSQGGRLGCLALRPFHIPVLLPPRLLLPLRYSLLCPTSPC